MLVSQAMIMICSTRVRTALPVEYFGCGGGSDTRPAGQAAFTKYSVATLGFGVISLTENTMRFSFVNEKGEQIYTYEIHKGAQTYTHKIRN